MAVGLAPAAARAETARPGALPLELEWSAPSPCPPASFVVQHVEQLVRGDLQASPKVAADARVERAPGGRWRLELTLRTGGVEQIRALEGSSCVAIAEACAVVIALAIDASAEGRTPPEASGAPPEPPEASEAEAPAETLEQPQPLSPSGVSSRGPLASPPASTSSSTVAFAFGLGAALSSGPLPKLGAGLFGSAAVRVQRLRVGVVGVAWWRQSPRFSETGGASFDLFEAGASAAYLFPFGRIAVGPGMDVEVAYMRVRGFGIRAPRASRDLWLTPGVGGRLEARLTPRLGLFARADALLPIAASRYVLATSSQGVKLHEPSRVGLRLSCGAEIVLF